MNRVRLARAGAERYLAVDKGRAEVFSNYRLRIAGVVRDYGMHARSEAPGDSRRVHD